MAKKPARPAKATALRRRAEERLRTTKREVAAMSTTGVQQLVHELQVHQLELEMQNEELRRTQAKLEAARDRYMELYDRAPTGYLTLNTEGMIVDANLSACTLLGITRQSLLDHPVIRLVAANDQVAFRRHMHELFNTGARQVCEVNLVRPDDVTVRVESVAVADERGECTRVLAVLVDITEHKRAEAMQRKAREVRDWISRDLHDGILQSLYAIGLSLEISKNNPSQVSDEALARHTQNIEALSSVMGEIRGFIRELASENQPHTVPSALNLREALPTMGRMLGQLHNQDVRVSIDNVVIAGLSPARSFELLVMAREAISNSLRHARASLVQVALLRWKKCDCFVVRDNGVGFNRKDASGVGQGLSNLRARAAKLGATLSIFSTSQQGTCLLVNLSEKSNEIDYSAAEKFLAELSRKELLN
jgi:PAS domain S-box-containing protein